MEPFRVLRQEPLCYNPPGEKSPVAERGAELASLSLSRQHHLRHEESAAPIHPHAAGGGGVGYPKKGAGRVG